MRRFVAAASMDGSLDPARLNVRATLPEILARLVAIYGLQG